MIRFVLLIVVFTALAASAGTPNFSRVDRLLRDSLQLLAGAAATDGGGVALLIWKDGKIIHRFEAAAEGRTFSSSRRIPIASATKGMSGTVLASLLEKGALRLDDSIAAAFPMVTAADKRRITVRQLFSFTSGFRGNIPGPTACVEDLTYQGTLADCVGDILAQPLRARPGAIFDYGSDGMHIAGRMAELASGLSIPSGSCWDALFYQAVVRPLGLTATSFDIPPLFTTDNPRIDGGAFSNADDYIRLCAMLLQRGVADGRRVMEERWIDTMMADQTRNATIVYSPTLQYRFLDSTLGSMRYGLGWWRERVNPQTGEALEVASQGRFGFSPWIDFERGYCAVLSVKSELSVIYPTYYRLKQLIREALDGAQEFTVTVNGGGPSRTYRAGDTVHVYSHVTADTNHRVWTCDGCQLERPSEWHTSFIMPSRNVTVTAERIPSPLPEWQEITTTTPVEASAWLAVPVGQVNGLIVVLHGTGGRGDAWRRATEYATFVRAALDRGWACLAPTSRESIVGDQNGDGKQRWATTPLDRTTNVDIATVAALLQRARSSIATLAENAPTAAVGMSNGGAFSGSLALTLGLQAGVSYCADGLDVVYRNTTIPTMFAMAERDSHEEVSNVEARENYERVRDRGVRAAFLLHPPQPLATERLLRIGLSESQIAAIHRDLIMARQLDSNLMLLRDADDIVATVVESAPAFPSLAALPASQRADLLDQLRVAGAKHQFFGDVAHTTVDFLEQSGTVSRKEDRWHESRVRVQGQAIVPGVGILIEQWPLTVTNDDGHILSAAITALNGSRENVGTGTHIVISEAMVPIGVSVLVIRTATDEFAVPVVRRGE